MNYKKPFSDKYFGESLILTPVIALLILLSISYFILATSQSSFYLVFTLLLMMITIGFYTYKAVKVELDEAKSETQAVQSLHSLIDIRFPLPLMTNYAASAELGKIICETILANKPKTIVECGSGVSTILSSYCLEKNGEGKLISLDHEDFYGSKTSQNLKNHQLEKFASVFHSPIKEYSLNGKKWKWYDISAVENETSKVDLLVIDGPPYHTQWHARYPALPLIHSKLSKNATVILDDAGRKWEQKIIGMWLKEYPEFTVEFINSRKGIAILSRNLA